MKPSNVDEARKSNLLIEECPEWTERLNNNPLARLLRSTASGNSSLLRAPDGEKNGTN
jgi:hypothetical protein